MRGFVRHTVLLATTGLLAAFIPAGAQRGMRGETRGQYQQGGATQVGMLLPVAPAAAHSDLSQKQRDEMGARKFAVKSMRETNAQARTQVMGILNPDQQKRAVELENDAREKVDETMRRQRDYQQDGGGRRRVRPVEG